MTHSFRSCVYISEFFLWVDGNRQDKPLIKMVAEQGCRRSQ